MFEDLYLFCAILVHITFRRREYSRILAEVGDMLRSPTYNPSQRQARHLAEDDGFAAPKPCKSTCHFSLLRFIVVAARRLPVDGSVLRHRTMLGCRTRKYEWPFPNHSKSRQWIAHNHTGGHRRLVAVYDPTDGRLLRFSS